MAKITLNKPSCVVAKCLWWWWWCHAVKHIDYSIL